MATILIGIACIVAGLYILFVSDIWGLKKYDREFKEWLENRKPINESVDIRSIDVE